MTNKQQTKNNASQKEQNKKLLQLQPLKLEQLEGMAGGPGMITGAEM